MSIYSRHTNEVLVVAWSPDNSNIASASDDDTVQIWDTMNGNRYVDFTGHSGFVVAMAWSPDGQYIASGGVDTTVQVWKAVDGTLVFKYMGHKAELEGVTWFPTASMSHPQVTIRQCNCGKCRKRHFSIFPK